MATASLSLTSRQNIFRIVVEYTTSRMREIMLFSLEFWKAAAERSLKTFAQTLLTLLGTDAVAILDVDITQAIIASLIAAGLSIATSVSMPSKVASAPNSKE